MADAKQILVVDDNFDTLELIRSMLEESSKDFQVLSVPSSEEAMLELMRINFDLLVTDVRLPGMSGFELIRWLKRVQPDIQTIVISGAKIDDWQKELDMLRLDHYFSKPIDNQEFLDAVNGLLYGFPEVEEPATSSASASNEVVLAPEIKQLSSSSAAAKRLDDLRSETGASEVFLVTAHGAIRYISGEDRDLDLPYLGALMADSLQNNFRIAEHLGSQAPFTIQYQAGERVELYTANISRHHILAMVFPKQARRGRIGTVWVFTQRAVKDLTELLEAESSPEVIATAPPTTKSTPKKTAQATEPVLPPSREPEPEPLPVPPTEIIVDDEAVEALDDLLDSIANAATPPATEEELAALLSETGMHDLMELEVDNSVNLDDFWDMATTNDEAAAAGDGVSLVDAMQQGILQTELVEELSDVLLPPPAAEVEVSEEELAAIDLGEVDSSVDLDNFWGAAVEEAAAPIVTDGAFSLLDAMQNGLVADEMEIDMSQLPPAAAKKTNAKTAAQPEEELALPVDSAVDVDAFWDAELSKVQDSKRAAVSFEEAMRLGLIKMDDDE